MDLQKAAKKLIKDILKIKKSEKVCLVADYENEVYRAIKKVLEREGLNFQIVKIRKERLHSSPIPEAKRFFSDCDVIIAPTKNSISHSPETTHARKKYGVRVASMPGINGKIFLSAMNANQKEIEKIGKFILRKLKHGKVVKITTPSGSDLEICINGIKFMEEHGEIKRGALNNVPFGEVCGFGIKGNGKICIDSWRDIRSKDEAFLYIENGRIVSWSKGADKFIRYLLAAGECGLKMVELGFGTNPGIKRAIGNVLNDEKIYGSVHIAFGGHGKIKCGVHEDIILLKPTVTIDGKKIAENGELLI
jgi:leucyl aminopeptidase (aminopeptidase T)